jgi:hypothetical protein
MRSIDRLSRSLVFLFLLEAACWARTIVAKAGSPGHPERVIDQGEPVIDQDASSATEDLALGGFARVVVHCQIPRAQETGEYIPAVLSISLSSYSRSLNSGVVLEEHTFNETLPGPRPEELLWTSRPIQVAQVCSSDLWCSRDVFQSGRDGCGTFFGCY